ncbi:MAG: MarR family winged helix-turn-helix transcriptional regulator [Candidatus Altiarchaeota archaeon]
MKKKKAPLQDLIFQKKPLGVILSLHGVEGRYPTKIAKEIDCTYTHTLKILSILRSTGIVEFRKHGRIKEVVLTEKGIELSKSIYELKEKFLK